MNPIDPWIDPVALRKLAESLLQPVPSPKNAGTEAGYGDAFVGFADPMGDPHEEGPAPQAAEVPSPSTQAPPRDQSEIEHQARGALANARMRAEHGGLLGGLPSGNEPAPGEGGRPASHDGTEFPDPDPGVTLRRAEGPDRQAPVDEQPQAAEPTEEQGSSAVPLATPPSAPQPVAPPPLPPEAREEHRRPSGGGPMIERLRSYREWLGHSVQAEAFFVADRDGHLLIDEVRSEKLLQVARTLANASHAANRQAGGTAVGSLHVKLANDRIMEVLPVLCSYGPLVLGIIVPGVLSASAVEVVARGLQQVVDGQNP